MIMTRAAVPRRHRGPGCPRSIASNRSPRAAVVVLAVVPVLECPMGIDDRIGGVLEEGGELEQVVGKVARVIAFQDREAALPVDPPDNLVNREAGRRAPFADERIKLGRAG